MQWPVDQVYLDRLESRAGDAKSIRPFGSLYAGKPGEEPIRTRPACAYPAQPVWDEIGNPTHANSFSCVQVHPRLAGDVDESGEVNVADFLVLSSNFGNSEAVWSDGDLDGDGIVEFADFLILSENFGQETSSREEGDLNQDGQVDFADFLILSDDFGKGV